MAGLCEGGNEPPGSLKVTSTNFLALLQELKLEQTSSDSAISGLLTGVLISVGSMSVRSAEFPTMRDEYSSATYRITFLPASYPRAT
ncbi:hypothetical protein ANN_04938 [Periplaneta americana]|uniref:Uncharacterized protein n=1 Tax=Periplaneta americana TaxID=6978 RepID=A0ABQ8TBP6_PERAM|nr:hypothetical protein ANN_04938 [Periplaneta americana]